MQLFFLPASLYTRKVCVVAIEAGLGDGLLKCLLMAVWFCLSNVDGFV